MSGFLNSFKSNAKFDIPASVAVFFVAIPLCLGIAHASNAPLISGLVSGIVGGIVIGFLSKSPLSVSGPAAGLTAVMIAGIEDVGSFEALLVAVVLAGVIQLILGLLKAGTVSSYFPVCVIKGMLAAIGVILIMKQLPHLLGYDIEMMGVEEFHLNPADINTEYHDTHFEEKNTFTVFFHALSSLKFNIFFIGVTSLAFLFYWDKNLAKKIPFMPGSIVVVAFGVIMNALYSAFASGYVLTADHLVNLPAIDGVSSFFAELPKPDWSVLKNTEVHILALTIALVASIETLLSIGAIDKLDPLRRRTPTNRELMAQGAGNVLAGFMGGLPMTSVIVRSSVNLTVGARSKMSTIMHGTFLLLGILFFAKYINYIPIASLAAILIHTGYKLASPQLIMAQYRQGMDQFLPSIITVISILMTDLLIGVLIGFAISALFIVRKTYKAPVLTLVDNGPRKRLILGENLHFLHKFKILDVLEHIPENTILDIDASNTLFIDHDIEESINEFKEAALEKNITVNYGGVKKVVQESEKIMEDMNSSYQKLLDNNKEWVKDKLDLDPKYFEELSKGQAPEYLFIGCSDSRVPAEDITKLQPGEMFVHRNIANMVINTDLNAMSVLQYAVEVLNVKHIIVCGHYGCGGVKAAMEDKELGLIDKWLRNIKDVFRLHKSELDKLDNDAKYKRLIELNVEEQVINLMKIPAVQKNRSLYSQPKIHGWVYDLETGYIKDLQVKVDEKFNDLNEIYKVY